jgi:hypothetical protein
MPKIRRYVKHIIILSDNFLNRYMFLKRQKPQKRGPGLNASVESETVDQFENSRGEWAKQRHFPIVSSLVWYSDIFSASWLRQWRANLAHSQELEL